MENKLVNVADLRFDGAGEAPSVYANNADMAITPWDIRIVFSEIGQHGDEFRKRLVASVVMNPAHAKALLTALATGVKQWEEIYGDIQMPQQQNPPDSENRA